MRLSISLLCLFCVPVFAAPPVGVTVRSLEAVAIHPVREAQAQAVSLNLAKLSAEIAARIDRIPVEPGQRIARHAVVAELDCGDARIAAERAEAALASAQARLKLARQQLQRNTELAARNFISGDALDSRKTEVEVAAADVKLNQAVYNSARRDVGKCSVRTPFPAIVEARLAQVGEWASPGTPLVQVWDTSRLQLAAQLQASEADSLTDPRFVSQGREYAVKLLRVSPALNPAARTREARFTFVSVPPAPGSHGVLRWRDPRAWLPADYLVRRGNALGVFIVVDDVARFVALADAQEGRPALAAGLPRTARLVVNGRFALQDGTRVTLQ
ncbi:MAG: efflux RND transporter periplasmic adaptor subunit [Thiobacillus sp.]